MPGVEGVTITSTLNITSTLDEDGIVIGRVADKDSQKIKFVASKQGYDSVTKEFDLSGLTVEEP